MELQSAIEIRFIQNIIFELFLKKKFLNLILD